jgi:fructoselysine-6-P-deglycase FrlB-like protein
MNSIDALKLDFKSQIRELGNINNKKICDNCVFVGSGDSYVAGLIAEFLTDHKCRCHSPSDLFNSNFLKDKTYCFISATGKTNANIQVARQAAQAGVKTVAVTLNKNSKLAEICNEIVPLNITRTNTPASGFSTFVSNVVACLQISGVTVPQKFDIWHKKGVELSLNFFKSMILPEETVYLLGNNILYALSLYLSLKMAEFFGTAAVAHKLEEFCHSPIFGIKKSDHIWVLGQKEETVSQKISNLGLNLSYFELYNSNVVTQIFQSIFFLQSLVLLLAERNSSTELEYRLRKDLLKCSSDIIYNNSN